MAEQNQQQQAEILSGSLIYVSDTHIRHMGDERGQLLLDMLQRIDTKTTEVLILNGDIFDFCFGARQYFRDKFAALGEALAKVAAAGVRVMYVEGNHEFHMQSIGWSGVEIITAADTEVTLRDGSRIKIAHGDLIKEDFWYRIYRGIVKSRLFAFMAMIAPPQWVDRFALGHAEGSRQRGEYRSLDHGALMDAANVWLGSEYQHGIFGHFHTPYAEKRQGCEGLIVCVESWDKPNVLVFGEGQFKRAYIKRPKEVFTFEPAAAILS